MAVADKKPSYQPGCEAQPHAYVGLVHKAQRGLADRSRQGRRRRLGGLYESAAQLYHDFIQAVGGLTILFASMPIMGFYSLISGGVYLWIGLFAQKRYKRYATGQKKAVAGAASEISDILGGFLVMKLYHTVKRLVSKNKRH